jgi:hypothetical protein
LDVSGEPLAFEATASVALLEPLPVGAKLTATLHVPPAATLVVLQLSVLMAN